MENSNPDIKAEIEKRVELQIVNGKLVDINVDTVFELVNSFCRPA